MFEHASFIALRLDRWKTPHLTYSCCTHHASFLSSDVCVAQHGSDREVVCALQKVNPHPCSTTHVRLAPVFPVHSSVGAHSLLDPPHVSPLCSPRQRDRFHRLAESSPATGCEPSDFIEESNSGVAPTVFQGSSCLFCFDPYFS